jgi:hypothetical protein
MLDVSASMRRNLREPHVEEFIRGVVEATRPKNLVAVDSSIVGSWPATHAGFAELIQSGGGSTELRESVRRLLQDAQRVLIVTDQGGLDTLRGLNVASHKTQSLAPSGILVRVCSANEISVQ